MPENAATETLTILRDLLGALETPGALNPAFAAHLGTQVRTALGEAGHAVMIARAA